MIGGQVSQPGVQPDNLAKAGDFSPAVLSGDTFTPSTLDEHAPPHTDIPAGIQPPPASYSEVPSQRESLVCDLKQGPTPLFSAESPQLNPSGNFVEFTPEVLDFAKATGVPPENIMRVLLGPAPKTPEEAEKSGEELAGLVRNFDVERLEKFRAENPEWFKKHATLIDDTLKDRAISSGPGILFTIGTLLFAEAIASVADNQKWLPIDRWHHGEERMLFMLGTLTAANKGLTVAQRSVEIWKNMRAGAGAQFVLEKKVVSEAGEGAARIGYSLHKGFGRALYASLTREFAEKSALDASLSLAKKPFAFAFDFAKGMGKGVLAQRAAGAALDKLNAWLKGVQKKRATPPIQILPEGSTGRSVFDTVAFTAFDIGELVFKKRWESLVAKAPAAGAAGTVLALLGTVQGAFILSDIMVLLAQRRELGAEQATYRRFFDQEVAKLVEKEEIPEKIHEEIRSKGLSRLEEFRAHNFADNKIFAARALNFFSPLVYSAGLTFYRAWQTDEDYTLRVTSNFIDTSKLVQGEAGLAPLIRSSLIDGKGADPDVPEFYFDPSTVDGKIFEREDIELTSEEQQYYEKYQWLKQNENLSAETKKQEVLKLIASVPYEKRESLQEKIGIFEMQANLKMLHLLRVDVNDHIREITNDNGAVKNGKGNELLKYAYPGMKLSADMREAKDAILLDRIEMLAIKISSAVKDSEKYGKLSDMRDKVFLKLADQVKSAQEGSAERTHAKEFLEDARHKFEIQAMRRNCREIINWPNGSSGFSYYESERAKVLKILDMEVLAATKESREHTRAKEFRQQIYGVIAEEREKALAIMDKLIAQAPAGSEMRKNLEATKEFKRETLDLKITDEK